MLSVNFAILTNFSKTYPKWTHKKEAIIIMKDTNLTNLINLINTSLFENHVHKFWSYFSFFENFIKSNLLWVTFTNIKLYHEAVNLLYCITQIFFIKNDCAKFEHLPDFEHISDEDIFGFLIYALLQIKRVITPETVKILT